MESRQGNWGLLQAVVMVMVMGGGSVWGLLPEQCPNKASNTCYFTHVARLQPAANTKYYAVGGLFNIHEKGPTAFTCGSAFRPDGVLLSHAFLWGMDYWQAKTSSAVSAAAVVFDTCSSEEQMTQYIMGFEQCNLRIEEIDRHDLVGFVGTGNSDGMSAARMTGSLSLMLISPTADSVLLSDHDRYPYYLRTSPSLQVDVDVMAAVLGEIDTKYVAAIYTQSEMATFQAFKMAMKDKDICITASFPMMGDESDIDITMFVNTSLVAQEKTRFIALFMPDEFIVRFIRGVRADDQARTMNLIFLIPSSIHEDSRFFDGTNTVAAGNAIFLHQRSPSVMDSALSDFKLHWERMLNGTASPNPRINNTFLTDYLSKAPRNQVPKDNPNLASTLMAAKAFVDGVAKAGRDICQAPNNYLCASFFNVPARGSNIKRNIRASTGYFTPEVNNVFLNGDLNQRMVTYDVKQYRLAGNFSQLGTYSNGVLTSTAELKGLAYKPGQCPDKPCLVCGEIPTTTPAPTTAPTTPLNCDPDDSYGNYSKVYYPPDQEITGAFMQSPRMNSEYETRFEVGQKWIIALGVLAGLGILSVLIFEIYILYKLLGTRMGHKWRTMWLGQLLLFGIFLCYLTLFAYILIPTKATCGITRFGVGVSYSICFAVLLVKLMVILTSKTSESSLLPGDADSPNYLKGVYQFLMFVFVVGVQVVIDAQWLITVPPEAVKVKAIHGGEVWVCNHYTFRASSSLTAMTDMSGFVRSEFENHVLSLVYIMFLILITTVLALNAHGIITNHRESVFIGIASGFSIPVWLAWTLVGGLNKDHDYAHEFGDACIAFGLFLTATLILFAMFLPKVRQLVSMGVEGIYFEDDRDTVYAGSVIMAPPSYKSRPNSVIYVNNQGIYSEPVVVGNGDSNYMRHPGSSVHTPASTYSAPPTYLKRGGDSTLRGGSVLRVTDDLSGRRPLEKKRPMSEVAYGTERGPRSHRGTLPRSRSHTSLGAL